MVVLYRRNTLEGLKTGEKKFGYGLSSAKPFLACLGISSKDCSLRAVLRRKLVTRARLMCSVAAVPRL